MIVCVYKKPLYLSDSWKWKKKNGRQLGGGENTWNCGSSNTRGVGILLI